MFKTAYTKLQFILFKVVDVVDVVDMTPLKLLLHHPYSRGLTHAVVMAVRWQQA